MAAATLLCTAVGFVGALSIGDRDGARPKTTLFEVFNAKSDGISRLGAGWSFPEAWGTWSNGPRAELTLALRQPPVSDVRMSIDARIYPFFPVIEQSVRVNVNGTQVAVIERNWEDGILGGIFYVPAGVVTAQQPMRIVFEITRPTSPNDVGEGADRRKLGLGLKSVTLEYLSY